MFSQHSRRIPPILLCILLALGPAGSSQDVPPAEGGYEFNDAHFHLTNYIQEGTSIQEFLKIMGTTVGRSVLSAYRYSSNGRTETMVTERPNTI